MGNVEIKVNIDVLCPEQVEALTALLTVIGNTTEATPVAPVKLPRVRKSKKKDEAKPEAETSGVEAETTSTDDDAPSLTLEILRSEASRKAKADTKNRSKIKKKLAELGASNIVKLTEEHYETFNEFLNTL